MIRKIAFILCLFPLVTRALFPDGSVITSEEVLDKILEEAVRIFVQTKIVINNEETTWQLETVKVTVPGRGVTLSYETEGEELSVELTPFKLEEDLFLLAAMSNFHRDDQEYYQFKSSFKSVKLRLNEVILFYPLGLKTHEALTGGNIYIELSIKILPYVGNTAEIQME